MDRTPLSRRKFIEQSALGIVGLSLSCKITAARTKSEVLIIEHSKVIDETGIVDQHILERMVNTALKKFTGKNTAADAWREFIGPDDVIGLKVNANGLMDLRGTHYAAHFPAVTSAIISGLKQAGIKEKKVVIWERSDEELRSAGWTIQKEPGSLRVMGNNLRRREPGGIGFSKEFFAVGRHKTHVSRIVTDICTALINIPVLKDHGSAGVTGSLKNHYGSIDNPFEFHSNNCTRPGIPEINAIPVIRKKERLIIVDALLGMYDGGPRWNRRCIWPVSSIIIGIDPVAVDSVMMKILDKKRKSVGLPLLEPKAQHLSLSEKLGLGVFNPEKYKTVTIKLG